jgi:hypothetical protein
MKASTVSWGFWYGYQVSRQITARTVFMSSSGFPIKLGKLSRATLKIDALCLVLVGDDDRVKLPPNFA